MPILCGYSLLKVVSHYDLSVLSTSVMGFHVDGLVGGMNSIQFFFGF